MGNSGKAIENSGKNNGKSGKSNNFCPKYMYMPPLSEFSHCFCPNFPIAFARISYCFCLNFPLLLPEFPIAFSQNSGKSNWKFGQKQWKNLAKAMRKLGKRWDIHVFRAKMMEVVGFLINQIKILKDLASSARIFSAWNSQYTWKYCIFDSGGSAMKKNRACYCEQVLQISIKGGKQVILT